MSKKRYLVFLFIKAKNVAMEYIESMDFLRTIKALHKHDRVEVVDLEEFGEVLKDEPSPEPKRRRSRPWATRIRCVETGEEWPSIAECSRRTGIAFFSINKSCKSGEEVYGLHYEYINEEKNGKN